MIYFSSAWLTTLYALLLRYEQQLSWLSRNDEQVLSELAQLTALQPPVASQLPAPHGDYDSLVNYELFTTQTLAPNSEPQLSDLEYLANCLGTIHDLEYWYRLWYTHISTQLALAATNSSNISEPNNSPTTDVLCQLQPLDAQQLSDLANLQQMLREPTTVEPIIHTLHLHKQNLIELIATCRELEAELTTYVPQPLTSYVSANTGQQLLIYRGNKPQLYQDLYNQAQLVTHPTYNHGLLPALEQAQRDGTSHYLLLYGIQSELDVSGLFAPVSLVELLAQLTLISEFVWSAIPSKPQATESPSKPPTPATLQPIPANVSSQASECKTQHTTHSLYALEQQLRTQLTTTPILQLQLQRVNRDREFGVVTKVLRTVVGWLPKLLCKDLLSAWNAPHTRQALLNQLATHLVQFQAAHTLSNQQLTQLSHAIYSYFMTDINNWIIRTLEHKQHHMLQRKPLVWNYWYAAQLKHGWLHQLSNSWSRYNFTAVPSEQVVVTWQARYTFNYALSYFNQLDAPSSVHTSLLEQQRYQQIGYTLAHYHHWGINFEQLDWTRWWLSNPTNAYLLQLPHPTLLTTPETPAAQEPSPHEQALVLIPDLLHAELRMTMGNWADRDLHQLQISLNDYVKYHYGILTTANFQDLLTGYQAYFDQVQVSAKNPESSQIDHPN